VGAGVLAVAALVAVTAVFASMPIPQRSWLDRWLTTRQAPLGAAANVIEPAPVACPARTPDPFPRDARSFATDTPQIWYWINPYTPRWLPPDAGLVLDRSWPEPTAHAVWTDAACDEIALFESPAAQGIKSERPQAATDWVRAELRWCPPDADPCFEFRAYVTSKGSRIRPKLWILRTVGLSRATAATVARSIPTRNVPYI
jgi:hypothetical protein